MAPLALQAALWAALGQTGTSTLTSGAIAAQSARVALLLDALRDEEVRSARRLPTRLEGLQRDLLLEYDLALGRCDAEADAERERRILRDTTDPPWVPPLRTTDAEDGLLPLGLGRLGEGAVLLIGGIAVGFGLGAVMVALVR